MSFSHRKLPVIKPKSGITEEPTRSFQVKILSRLEIETVSG